MRKDIEVLESAFEVSKFSFIPKQKWLTPFLLTNQLCWLIINTPNSAAIVTLFGGYHSFLPTLFAKLFRKPSIVILGGSDCVSFPSIHYGNFNNLPQGIFTRWSLNLTSHIAPVDASLVLSEYNYTDSDHRLQGYKAYCPKANAPVTTIHFGYDPDLFKHSKEKIPGSFLTVGYLNSANYYRKGIDLIFNQALRRPENRFTIIGGTAKDIPSDLRVPENVEMIASVSYEELTAHYSSHQFYFQLSLMEGFPSAICEAMLCECIPIGSDVAAIPTIIGDTGYILKKKDPELLHELVTRALNEANSKSGEKARARIEEKYPKNERYKLLELVKAEIARFS